jgi:hypothetical protein
MTATYIRGVASVCFAIHQKAYNYNVVIIKKPTLSEKCGEGDVHENFHFHRRRLSVVYNGQLLRCFNMHR